jgi:hypothetical protein
MDSWTCADRRSDKLKHLVMVLALGLALALVADVEAQQFVVAPVAATPWTGFASDFDPQWSGVSKRVDRPVGGGGGGGSGGGTVINFVGPSPPVPTPIGLVSSNRKWHASALATVENVEAVTDSGNGGGGLGRWDVDAAQYAEVLNLQDVLLSRGATAADQVSTLTHNSIAATGRVIADASLLPAVAGDGSAASSGISSLEATYQATAPIWFELSGEVSGAGSMKSAVSIVNFDTNQTLYSLAPDVTEMPTTWAFGVKGALPAGNYTVSVSATATARIDSSASNRGGRGEYALSFVASPRPLGDANGEHLVDGDDLASWKSSFGFMPDGDWNSDGVIDGSDFLRWQTEWRWNPSSPVAAWQLEIWRNGFGFSGGGDTDGDRDADGADFLMWQRKLSAAPQAASVPEPAAMLLVAAGIVGLVVPRLSRCRLVRRRAS